MDRAERNKRIGERLRALRDEYAISAPQLAEKSSVSLFTIRRIERGGGARPETLRKIANNGFDLPVTALTRVGKPDTITIEIPRDRVPEYMLGLLTQDDMR
jgi:transcriptional regulator with XRE-family HTH domain